MGHSVEGSAPLYQGCGGGGTGRGAKAIGAGTTAGISQALSRVAGGGTGVEPSQPPTRRGTPWTSEAEQSLQSVGAAAGPRRGSAALHDRLSSTVRQQPSGARPAD